MAFNLKNSFTGGNVRLSNGQSYGNDIRDQFEIGQGTSGASGNGSSSYKKVKPTGGSEPKKYPMHFLFGNQEITFYTPYNIWMSEGKFQQMQQKKQYEQQKREYAKQIFRLENTEIQDYSRKNNVNTGVHGGINTSAIDSLASWRAGQTATRMNHRTDVLVGLLRQGELADETRANTGRMMHQGIGADISLFGNGNQNSEGLSAYALNNDGQSIGRTMPERYMVNLAAGSNTDDSIQEIPKIGYNPVPWWSKGDLGTGELVVMPEFFQTVDDVVRHYGGWTGIENEIPEEMRGSFSAAYTFLSTWGLEYANFLVSKAPVPLNVKAAITAGLFLIGVCEALKEVKTKRDTMIKNLNAGGMSLQQAEAEANKMVDGWLLEEIGKVAIETMIGTTMDQLGLTPYQQNTIIAAWNTFVDQAESGIWEYGVVR